MDLALTTPIPEADASGLTSGNPYSVYHSAGITASVVIGGSHCVIYQNDHAGSFYLPRLAGTVIRCALSGAGPITAGLLERMKSVR